MCSAPRCSRSLRAPLDSTSRARCASSTPNWATRRVCTARLGWPSTCSNEKTPTSARPELVARMAWRLLLPPPQPVSSTPDLEATERIPTLPEDDREPPPRRGPNLSGAGQLILLVVLIVGGLVA